MREPMVVREPGICPLITQTAPIIFTPPRYEIDAPYLTKANLMKLNGICGDKLHRGSPEEIRLQPETGAPLCGSTNDYR